MLNLAYFGGNYEWLIIAGVVVLLFGSTKVPQLFKGMGEGIREFKKSVSGDETDGSATPAAPGTSAKTETVETTTTTAAPTTTVVTK